MDAVLFGVPKGRWRINAMFGVKGVAMSPEEPLGGAGIGSTLD